MWYTKEEHKYLKINTIYIYILFSQLVPTYPTLQLHTYVEPLYEHAPLSPHGSPLHGVLTESRNVNRITSDMFSMRYLGRIEQVAIGTTTFKHLFTQYWIFCSFNSFIDYQP